MDEELILKLKELLQNPTKSHLQTVGQVLRRQSNQFTINTEKALLSDPLSSSLHLSQQVIDLSIETLQSSSKLLKGEEIDVNFHAELEGIAVSLILIQLSQAHCANNNKTSTPPLTLDFTDVFFTKPLVLSNVHLKKLRFTGCIFANAFHLTAVSCATPIEIIDTRFTSQGSLLIRMISFPKPDPPSEWAPSFIFRNCLIQSIEVFRAEVFLFFTESTIRNSSLQLPTGAVAQYVNCQVNDGIIYGVAPNTDGNSLVPRWWYREVGWSI